MHFKLEEGGGVFVLYSLQELTSIGNLITPFPERLASRAQRPHQMPQRDTRSLNLSLTGLSCEERRDARSSRSFGVAPWPLRTGHEELSACMFVRMCACMTACAQGR